MYGKWFGFEREEVFEEGISRFEVGDYEEASKAFEACQKDDPSDARFDSYLTVCYERLAAQALEQQDFREAAAMVENAIVLQPKRRDLHLIAAKAFQSMQKMALAKFHMTRALAPREEPLFQ